MNHIEYSQHINNEINRILKEHKINRIDFTVSKLRSKWEVNFYCDKNKAVQALKAVQLQLPDVVVTGIYA